MELTKLSDYARDLIVHCCVDKLNTQPISAEEPGIIANIVKSLHFGCEMNNKEAGYLLKYLKEKSKSDFTVIQNNFIDKIDLKEYKINYEDIHLRLAELDTAIMLIGKIEYCLTED